MKAPIIAIFLLALSLALAGCQGPQTSPETSAGQPAPAAQGAETTPDAPKAEEPPASPKVETPKVRINMENRDQTQFYNALTGEVITGVPGYISKTCENQGDNRARCETELLIIYGWRQK